MYYCRMPKIRELIPAEKSQIFNKRLKGETLRKIASDFNISAECVRKVVNRLKNQRYCRKSSEIRMAKENNSATESHDIKRSAQKPQHFCKTIEI